ncbi:WD repeat-containing protein 97 isoform X2 [Vulpes vulpes]|uniref:WD repeat-containing protein 97 isoform X2 n=1 Tax=Vulpes vulpes TaxID=9627 RepID=A0ABM4ZHC0_VULVU
METEVSDASDSQLLDQDLYDTDGYDVPDPGLLKERNDSFPEPAPPLFTSSSRLQNMTPRARARQLWLLLRAGLRDFVEKEKREELCVARLTHGLELLRHLKVAAELCWVAQDPVGRRFVVLDGAGYLHLHRENGWAYEKLQAPAVLTGLVAVPGPLGAVSRFVGWGPEGLAILRPDFSLLWLSKPGVGGMPDHQPICCLPVPSLGLLLVALAGGSLALWKFRSGGRRLVLWGSPLRLPPSSAGTLTRLVLGPLSSHQVPCCLAAYGSAVLIFDLHTWALVDIRRDLHKITISDLAYCLEVDAVVTASRDSTVKVWETDWRLRMVFMGHTGPVTAVAVLPDSSLLLSASQDGTLRTWDLQAAAQVGEVALSGWARGAAAARVDRLLAPAGPGCPVLSLSARGVALWRPRELYAPLARLPAPVLLVQVAPALPAAPRAPLPARLVCACADGSVHLLAAATGRPVSALLLGAAEPAAALLYCLPREALWLLTRAGHLLCASAARRPMRLRLRLRPPPAPAPRPCCLHLYSHLADPRSALAAWEAVRRRGGELPPGRLAGAWDDKNRYLPVLGHTDGTLSVLEWRHAKTVFHTAAHSPGPVTAIASTWNSVVSSGGDLTVKMWRVYPYAEESLSLLRTFSCWHPVVVLCALGKRVTVGFEDPDTATYGLVQFGLGNSPRCDHRPQDDHTDHITGEPAGKSEAQATVWPWSLTPSPGPSGLCCCPTLKLYASSSLDGTVRIWTAENRLLRLLQLDSPPQALAFCSNSGDLVLALGSRLCLVSHRLYLPTSYLVKKLCQNVPEVLDDPPLPLTSQESLTSAQLQRLAKLHGAASLSTDLSFIHHQTGTPQQPVLEEDLEALVTRDQDLQQLRLGLVVPAAQPPLSWQQQQEAFDNYLRLVYGPGFLGVPSGRESQQESTVTLIVERETWDVCTLPRAASSVRQAGVCAEAPTVPAAHSLQDLGAVGQHLAHPPRVPMPTPHTHRGVHSRASQLLARSSLSSSLGLSLDLQLQLERLPGEKRVGPGPPTPNLQHRVPLLTKRRPRELLSNLRGFFPAAIEHYKNLQTPIRFPGSVPNSVVLQHMWLPGEVSGLGALAQISSRGRHKARRSLDDVWLPRRIRRRQARYHQKLIQWLGEEEEKEEEEEERNLDWASDYLSAEEQLLELEELEAQAPENLALQLRQRAGARTDASSRRFSYPYGRSLWKQRYGHLPRFLHFFVVQNWFQKLFPVFTLEVRGLGRRGGPGWWGRWGVQGAGRQRAVPAGLPRGGHGGGPGLAVHRPAVRGVLGRLRAHPASAAEAAARREQGPSGPAAGRPRAPAQPGPAPQPGGPHAEAVRDAGAAAAPGLLPGVPRSGAGAHVLLPVLASLLPVSLAPRSSSRRWGKASGAAPLTCPRPELKKLLDGLGLQDPQGFLFKEMMTWVQGPDADSKAALRKRCCQKLEEMIHWLQMESLQPSAAKLSEMLPRVCEPSAPAPSPKEVPSQVSVLSGSPHESVMPSVPSWAPSLVVSPGKLDLATLESPAKKVLPPMHFTPTRRMLSETLLHFSRSEGRLSSSVPTTLREEPLPLEQTDWSRSQMLDLGPIDALNFFCEQQRVRQQRFLQEEQQGLHPSPSPSVPNTVLPQPRDCWHYPILRLQEAKLQRAPTRLRGWMRSQLWVARTLNASIRMLKLPLPRVELQPFPPDWPRPARPLPPLLLQPAFQRYFLPDDTNPDSYS